MSMHINPAKVKALSQEELQSLSRSLGLSHSASASESTIRNSCMEALSDMSHDTPSFPRYRQFFETSDEDANSSSTYGIQTMMEEVRDELDRDMPDSGDDASDVGSNRTPTRPVEQGLEHPLPEPAGPATKQTPAARPTEWVEYKIPGVSPYPRELFRDPAASRLESQRDEIPVSTVRYASGDSLDLSDPRDKREVSTIIQQKLDALFPIDDFQFHTECKILRETKTWVVEITPNKVVALSSLTQMNFKHGNGTLRFVGCGPAHPLNVTMMAVITPEMENEQEAWTSALASLRLHEETYSESHGSRYEVLGGWAGFKVNPRTLKRYFCRDLLIQIRVPFSLEGSQEGSTWNQWEHKARAVLPVESFHRVPGWIAIGTVRPTQCRTNMYYRFRFCTFHKNRWGGDLLEDGSGRRVNARIHSSRECLCTICGEAGHGRPDCARKPEPRLPQEIEFVEDSPEEMARLKELAELAMAAAAAEEADRVKAMKPRPVKRNRVE